MQMHIPTGNLGVSNDLQNSTSELSSQLVQVYLNTVAEWSPKHAFTDLI